MNLTPESIENVLKLKPELRDQMVAALDEQIEGLQKTRAELVGDRPAKGGRGRRAASTSGNTMTHGEAVLKILNLPKFRKKGAMSRDIKAAASEVSHEFGSSLGTTLDNLFKQNKVAAEREGEKSQYTYTAIKA